MRENQRREEKKRKRKKVKKERKKEKKEGMKEKRRKERKEVKGEVGRLDLAGGGRTSPAAAGVGRSWPGWVDKALNERVDSGASVVQYEKNGVLQTPFFSY